MTDPKERPEAASNEEAAAETSASTDGEQDRALRDDETQAVVGGASSDYTPYTSEQSQADQQSSRWAKLPQSSPGFGE